MISRWGFTKNKNQEFSKIKITTFESKSFLGNLVRFKTRNHDLRNSLKYTKKLLSFESTFVLNNMILFKVRR